MKISRQQIITSASAGLRRLRQPAVYAPILLVLILVFAALYRQQADAPARKAFAPVTKATIPSSNTPSSAGNGDADQFCSRVAGALECRPTLEASATTYRLPNDAAKAASIQPSPSGDRLLVVSAPNPLRPAEPINVTVTDAAFKPIRTIDKALLSTTTSIAWSANDDYLVYLQSEGADKGMLYTYDIAKATTRRVGEQTYKGRQPQVSRDGKTIFMLSETAGKPFEVITAESLNGNQRQANVSAVADVLQTYSRALYQPQNDTWFISGVAKQGGPALVVATYRDDVFTVRQIVKQADAYALYGTTGEGVVALRTGNGSSVYGIVNDQGVFKPRSSNSSTQAPFVTGSAIIAMARQNSPTEQYVYDYTTIPAGGLRNFVQSLVTKDCPVDSFNQVDVLARKDTDQAVINVTGCTDPITLRYYYVARNGSYENALQSSGPADCEEIVENGIDRGLAPDCTTVQHGPANKDEADAVQDQRQVIRERQINDSQQTIEADPNQSIVF